MISFSDRAAEAAHAVLERARSRWRRAHWRREDQRQLQGVELPEMTEEEIRALKAMWPFLRIDRDDLAWARLYKQVYGFDPGFLGSVNQFYDLREQVNPYRQVCSLENKALCDVYFPEVPFPEVYVRGLGGSLYDRERKPLSLDEAASLLREKESFILKPALESMCGKGFRKFVAEEIPQLDGKWLAGILQGVPSEFVIQESVRQHPDMTRLNPTSLNCCRITSVYVGSQYTFAALQKVGKRGSPIDNWDHGYFVGIEADGRLKKNGWDSGAHPVFQTDGGLPFEGLKVPGFTTMVEAAERFHRYFLPQCGIIGWDMVVDAAGDLKVIEANLTVPGLPSEQLCSGPFLKPVRDALCHVFGY